MIDYTPDSTPLKQCSKCQEYKPATADFFNRDIRRRDGLDPHCKACKNIYYQQNRDRLKAKSLVNYRENRESKLKYASQYRADNKPKIDEWKRDYRSTQGEKVREQQRSHYAANKDRYIKKFKAYRAANKEKIRNLSRQRKARQRNAPGTHTVADIERQYKAQKGQCYYCRCDVGDSYHVDHVIPLSRGGSNNPDNLVIACPTCNVSKKDKLPHEWKR